MDKKATLRDSDRTSRPIDHLELHSARVIKQLQDLGVRFAVVGGIAVSLRTVERTTKDLDLAVAVNSDAEAESIVLSLSRSGYYVDTLLEQEAAGRLSTVRFISRGEVEMFVDLLFASSGIENEVVGSAEVVEIFPGVTARVATTPSLIALKVLSANPNNRLQDILDLQNLVKDAAPSDLETARKLLELVIARGFHRNKNLLSDLDAYVTQFRDDESRDGS